MGCGSSADDVRVARLLAELEETKTKAGEQQNLLRFKVEVLVNMLAMEEKKSESIEKRVETLKWLLHSQGVAEQTLTSILLNAEKADQETRANMMGSVERSISFRNVGLVDLAGAMSRAQEEFALYRTDIISAFAGEDGKVVASLTNDDFMKQLYQVTEKLSKADIQIIALRFGDGSGFVSIPEFLEFFATPAHIRMAKSASAAVRMSLDLLQLTSDEEFVLQQGEEEEESENGDGAADGDNAQEGEGGPDSKAKGFLIPQVLSTHLTSNLDRAVRRLLAMWPYVKKELEMHFSVLEKPTIAERDGAADEKTALNEQFISVELFQSALLEKCGIKSGVLGRADTEGRIVFNRTGKPMLTKQPSEKPSGTPTPSSGTSTKSVDAAADAKSGARPAAGKGEKGSQPTPLGPKQDSKGSPLSRKGSANNLTQKSPGKSGTSTKSGVTEGTATPPTPPIIEPLQEADVTMLTERFELGGFVHYGHVLQYFNELHAAIALGRRKHVALPANAASTASPFLITSEWEKLRASAVLKQYAIAQPPPPPAAPVAMEPAPPAPEPKAPTPAPKAPEPPKPEVKKGIDAADYKPGKLPPPASVEVVEPGKGMFCCGGGRPRPAANRPEPLPVGADAKTAWDDPDAQDEGPAEAAAESKDDASTEEDHPPIKEDRGFSTPEKGKLHHKLSFQPRKVTRDLDDPEENVERSGLGKKALNDTHDSGDDRPVRRVNHFRHRDQPAADAGKKATLGDSGSDEGGVENSFNRTNTRGDTRWR